MTLENSTLYFVRHCQSDFTHHDQLTRPLTIKGLEDRNLIETYFEGRRVDIVLSSPYLRAVQTVSLLAEKQSLAIQVWNELRERDSHLYADQASFLAEVKKRWDDRNYKVNDEESLADLEARSTAALQRILAQYPGRAVVIGSHGSFIASLFHHFDKTYGYEDFLDILHLMPFVAKFKFHGVDLVDLTFEKFA